MKRRLVAPSGPASIAIGRKPLSNGRSQATSSVARSTIVSRFFRTEPATAYLPSGVT